MSRENVEVVAASLREFKTTQRPTRYLAPGWVWETRTFRGWPEEDEYRGDDGFMKFFAKWTEPYDEWHMDLEEVVDVGDDRVVAILRQRGRLRGADSWVELRYGTVFTVERGRITRGQVFMTAGEALEAVGVRQPENVEPPVPPEEVEDLIRWGYDWFNREKEPPPNWLPDGEFVNAREDPDHATYRGIKAIRKQHQGWFDSYPNLRVEPLEIRVNGDRVFVWARFTGHGAESGAALEMELAHVFTLEGQKTRRLEEYFDRDEALEAVGLREPSR